MAKVLWVGEKKSLAEAVGKVLGNPVSAWDSKGMTHNQVGDNFFVWLDGHAFDQAMPDHYLPDDVPKTGAGRKVWRKSDLPVVPDVWTLFPKESKQRRLDKLAELLQTCDVVHHLGDPDEEGQLLVDEALLFYGNRKPVKRVLVNDYNETKVRQSLANIRDNNEPMFRGWYKWGLARSHYDWLLGLNCTRAMTLRGRELGFDGLLPVGSVQTPLLYIVYERDRAIETFKPIPYFSLVVHLRHANGVFKANWKAKEDQAGLDDAGRLIDPTVAASLVSKLSGQTGTITAYAKIKKEQKAPLPLSMNELQMEGFARYGYTGQQVLDAGQKLYEVYKVTTYPRSDNRYLSEAQHKEAPAVIAEVFKRRPDLAGLTSVINPARKSDAFNDKKMEGNPHHGIVPTVPDIPVNIASWTEIERNVYDLVVRSYLAQFAPPFEYMQTTVEADIAGERFAASGKTPVAQGWKAVFAEVEDKDDDQADADESDEGKQTLPPMAKGDRAACAKCDQVSRKTTPPTRFDDKLLLEAMMNVYKYVKDEKARKRLKDGGGDGDGAGIGTTATRAGIIQELKDRELIVPVKPGAKKLMTSSTARTLIEALPMDVKDPAQAGVFKASLDRVAKGELSYDQFIADTVDWITTIVQAASNLTMKLPLAAGAVVCPKCKGGQLRRKDGGDKGAYWYCANWNREPDKCDARFQDVNGKPLLVSAACPKCKTGNLRRKDGAKGIFWFCSNWNREPDKCDARYDDKLGKPDTAPKPVYKCPSCKEGSLRSISGDNGKFWGCSRYSEGCKTTYPDKLGKPDMAPKPVYKCIKCKQGELRSIPGPKGKFWGCSRYKEGCKATHPDKAGKPDFTAKPK